MFLQYMPLDRIRYDYLVQIAVTVVVALSLYRVFSNFYINKVRHHTCLIFSIPRSNVVCPARQSKNLATVMAAVRLQDYAMAGPWVSTDCYRSFKPMPVIG